MIEAGVEEHQLGGEREKTTIRAGYSELVARDQPYVEWLGGFREQVMDENGQWRSTFIQQVASLINEIGVLEADHFQLGDTVAQGEEFLDGLLPEGDILAHPSEALALAYYRHLRRSGAIDNALATFSELTPSQLQLVARNLPIKNDNGMSLEWIRRFEALIESGGVTLTQGGEVIDGMKVREWLTTALALDVAKIRADAGEKLDADWWLKRGDMGMMETVSGPVRYMILRRLLSRNLITDNFGLLYRDETEEWRQLWEGAEEGDWDLFYAQRVELEAGLETAKNKLNLLESVYKRLGELYPTDSQFRESEFKRHSELVETSQKQGMVRGLMRLVAQEGIKPGLSRDRFDELAEELAGFAGKPVGEGVYQNTWREINDMVAWQGDEARQVGAMVEQLVGGDTQALWRELQRVIGQREYNPLGWVAPTEEEEAAGIRILTVDFRSVFGRSGKPETDSPLIRFMQEYITAADTPLMLAVKYKPRELLTATDRGAVWTQILKSKNWLTLDAGFGGDHMIWRPDLPELIAENRVVMAMATKGSANTLRETVVEGVSGGQQKRVRAVKWSGGMLDAAGQVEMTLKVMGLAEDPDREVVHVGHSMAGRTALLLGALLGLRSRVKLIPIAPVMSSDRDHLLLTQKLGQVMVLTYKYLRELAGPMVGPVVARYTALMGDLIKLTPLILNNLVVTGEAKEQEKRAAPMLKAYGVNFRQAEIIFRQLAALMRESPLTNEMADLLAGPYRGAFVKIFAGGADGILRTKDMTDRLQNRFGSVYEVLDGAPHHVWLVYMEALQNAINQGFEMKRENLPVAG